ncbi:hypothetical protein ACFFX1_38375 [Dactylosporangium sucinum]|uniref:Uncharacterized protein n=1 Tax=Dactylosporangium sucinum TaxID=1424081 RepID=A0A917WNM8_9ACTN|nr:hypothetical protein [Dactylosporangium sucinum]GGM19051.1 hypothetical protein GCM10007977_020350 [Dactylosporangium sucinum]
MALTEREQAQSTTAPPARPWRTALGITAVAVVGTAAGILRQGGAGALNTIWAEDGQIFLTQAVDKGVGAFTTSYAGYYHLVARIVAAIAAALPASWAAATLALGAALVTTLFAIAVYRLSGEYLPSPLARLLVSVPVALLPMSQGDVLNSPANLHWTGLYLLFWLLVSRPPTMTGKVFACAGIVLVAGSDILTAIYVPLAAFIIWFHRDRYAVVKAVAFAVPFGLQVLGLLTGQSEREGLAPAPVLGVKGYVFRAIPSTFFGERWVGAQVTTHSLIFTGLSLLVLAAVLLLAWRGFTTARWWFALAAALHSVGLYVLPVALSGVATPRYNVAPALLLLVAVASLLLPHETGEGTPLAVFALLFAVVLVVNFRVGNARANGPAWDDGLESAQVACAQRSGGSVEIEVPPLAAPGWHATLPCDYVDRN